jgi:hypothetical protein
MKQIWFNVSSQQAEPVLSVKDAVDDEVRF